MHMSFWFGYDIGDFFFQGLTIDSTGKMVALCAVLTILSIFFEAMKVHNAQAKAKAARELQTRGTALETSSDSPLLNVEPVNESNGRACISKTLKGMKEGAFFLLQNALGYALMLCVMIYNGYLFIAVVGGKATMVLYKFYHFRNGKIHFYRYDDWISLVWPYLDENQHGKCTSGTIEDCL